MPEPQTTNDKPETREALAVLIPAEAIQARVRELGAAISRDYAGKDLLLVGILRGAIFLTSDTLEALNVSASDASAEAT